MKASILILDFSDFILRIALSRPDRKEYEAYSPTWALQANKHFVRLFSDLILR